MLPNDSSEDWEEFDPEEELVSVVFAGTSLEAGEISGEAHDLYLDEEIPAEELIAAYDEEIQATLDEIAALVKRHDDLVEQRQKLRN
ncbi:MAG: hypothetical protein JOZ57_09260, partial [Abitibacteriaceae bacterium]|nr:hypothetical protein [Abditibacteriaceae bacterium]